MHDIAISVRLNEFNISTGYYPPGKEETFNEDSPGGDFDFLSRLCTDWEAAATLQDTVDVRSVKIRAGLASLFLWIFLIISSVVNDFILFLGLVS